jgi:eukaryotic-like serine/threonine-protein kinase
MNGKAISHYAVHQRIGGGGMGVVYKAEDTLLQRTVALKLLPPELTDDPEAKERLLSEARAASSFQHQNICTIHEVGETDDGQVFICMDYYEGETLKERLSRLRSGGALPMSLSAILDIAIQTGQGLAIAHEKGIVHRDIKPANVIITTDGVVKILDFGIARLAGTARLTQIGKAVGTISYLSPEQAGGRDVDSRTDIWSLGVVLYEMCTGRLPFARDVDAAVIYAILDKTPVPPSQMGVDVPQDLENAILKCLEKNPDDRFQSVAELLDDLYTIWKSCAPEDQKIAIHRRRGVYEQMTVLRRLRLHGRWPYLASATVLLFAAVLLFFLFRSGRSHGSIHSLAVLPLKNLTNDKTQNYFVAGIHEELLTDLAKIKALKVISRTSMMRYANTTQPAPEITKELNVDALVEGSVMRIQNHVRVNVQLIDGATDTHLWAQSYDRDPGDLLAMLSEVAQAITREIAVNISPEETHLFAQPHPVNAAAHDEYFKGLYLLYHFSFSRYTEALEHFHKATEIDPSFGPGYVGQSYIYFLMGIFRMRPSTEVIPTSRNMVMKALELDEATADAHALMSWIKLACDWDWPGAAREVQRALDLNPGNVIALHVYADYLVITGHPKEGLHQVDLAREYDPFSPMAVMPAIYHHLLDRRYDSVIKECRNLLAADPEYPIARTTLRDALWLKGMYEESIEEYRKTWGKDDTFMAAITHGYAAGGPRGAVRELARVFAQRARPCTGEYLEVADLYSHTNERDSAIVWLERSCDERSPFLMHLEISPFYDSLRADPRFHALQRRIGFPDTGQENANEQP